MPRNLFYDCTSLEDVDISNVTAISEYSFYNTTSLNGIEAPKVVSVGSQAFYKSGITYFEAPNLTTIAAISSGVGVFQYCTNLARINLEKIETIGGNAFYNCTSLSFENLQLPNLTSLGQNAFYGVKIKKISDLGKITTLPTASRNTQNFGDKSVLEEVVLPETVTALEGYVFYNYTSLRTINLENVTFNGHYHFINCTSLEGDLILSSAMRIGGDSFRGCKKITSVVADNIQTVDFSPFKDCSALKTIVLGNSLTAIGSQFAQASGLNTLIIKAATPPTLTGASWFPSQTLIYVPDESVEVYRAATNWSIYADRIKPLSEYVES